MNSDGQTICLNMIVKNEAHVISRCLNSVRPLIDAWVIADTGSTDGTQDIIRELLSDIPGELLERPWVNFGHNRTEVLEASRHRCDYTLIIDADDVLEIAADFVVPLLTVDAYFLHFHNHNGLYDYHRRQLVRSELPWRYVGVLHEHLECDREPTTAVLSGARVLRTRDGARSLDPLTSRRDVDVLEKALLDEPENSRYVFYLAQSYRDADDLALAIKQYQRRATMGGWCDEVWYSLYQIALLKSLCNAPWPEVLTGYLAAAQYLPSRVEPLYRIAMQYQKAKEFHLAKGFFEWALNSPVTSLTGLCVERAIYDYRLELEYAVCCYYTGAYVKSVEVNDWLLSRGNLPADMVDLVKENREYGLRAISETKGGIHDDAYSPRPPSMCP